VIAAYYRFARAADDIADDPTLDATEKTRRLDSFDETLVGKSDSEPVARELRGIFTAHRLTIEHARHLLQAFKADAINRPCRNWSDLLAYCRYSAAPVGRFLLELHREDRQAWPAADALCSALQILNHLQDCQADWRDLKRLYIPRDWLDEAKITPDALLETRASLATRQVFDRTLEGVEWLNTAASSLPGLIADRQLRMEATAILFLSRRLARRLRRRDPLAGRVGISTADKFFALLYGVLVGWRR
jgi:squalene synthase HpnC